MTDTTAVPQVETFRVGNLALHIEKTAETYREAIAHHLRTQSDTSALGVLSAHQEWETLRAAWSVLTGCHADQVEDQAKATTGVAYQAPWTSE